MAAELNFNTLMYQTERWSAQGGFTKFCAATLSTGVAAIFEALAAVENLGKLSLSITAVGTRIGIKTVRLFTWGSLYWSLRELDRCLAHQHNVQMNAWKVIGFAIGTFCTLTLGMLSTSANFNLHHMLKLLKAPEWIKEIRQLNLKFNNLTDNIKNLKRELQEKENKIKTLKNGVQIGVVSEAQLKKAVDEKNLLQGQFDHAKKEFQSVLTQSKNVQNKLSNEIQTLNQRLLAATEQSKSREGAYQQQISRLQDEIKSLNIELNKKNNLVINKNKEITILNEKIANVNMDQNSLALEELKKERDQALRSIHEAKATITQLENSKKTLSQQVDSLKNENNKQSSKLEALTNESSKILEEIIQIQSNLAKKYTELKKHNPVPSLDTEVGLGIIADVGSAIHAETPQQALAILNQSIDMLATAADKEITNGQQDLALVTEDRRNAENNALALEKENDKQKAKIFKLKTTIEQLKNKLEEVSRKTLDDEQFENLVLQKVEKEQERLKAELQKKINAAVKQKEAVEEDFERIKNEHLFAVGKVEEFKKHQEKLLSELEKKEGEIIELQSFKEESSQLREQVKMLKQVEKDYETGKKISEAAKEKLEEAEQVRMKAQKIADKITKLDAEKKEAEEKIANLTTQLESCQADSKKAEALKVDIEKLLNIAEGQEKVIRELNEEIREKEEEIRKLDAENEKLAAGVNIFSKYLSQIAEIPQSLKDSLRLVANGA